MLIHEPTSQTHLYTLISKALLITRMWRMRVLNFIDTCLFLYK